MHNASWRLGRTLLLMIAAALIGYSLVRIVTRPGVGAEWLSSGEVTWLDPVDPAPGLALGDRVTGVDGLTVEQAGMFFPNKAAGDQVALVVIGPKGEQAVTLHLHPTPPSDWLRSLGILPLVLSFYGLGALLVLRRPDAFEQQVRADWVGAYLIFIALSLSLGSLTNRGPQWAYQAYVVNNWLTGAIAISAHLVFPHRFIRTHHRWVALGLVALAGAGIAISLMLPAVYNGAVSALGRQLLSIWMLAAVGSIVGLLVVGLRVSTSLSERRQTGIVAAGGIAAIIPFTFFVLLPRMSGASLSTHQLEFLPLLFIPAAYGYGLLRFRHLAHDGWVPRMVVLVLTVSFVGLVVGGGLAALSAVGLAGNGLLAAAVGLTAGAMAIGLSVIRRWLDWLLFRRSYDPLVLTDEVVRRLNLRVDTPDVPGQIEAVIRRELDMPSQVLIRLGQTLRGGVGELSMASSLVQAVVRAGRLVERDELERVPGLALADRALLATTWIQSAIALDGRSGLTGLLLLGHKASAPFVDPQDVRIISIISLVAGQVLESAASFRKLQETPRLIARARADERHYLAREIHDQHIQPLNSFIWGLAQLRGRVASLEQVEALRQQISGHMDGLRGVCAQLRSSTLETLGLENALRSLAKETAEKASLETIVQFNNPNQVKVPNHVAESCYGVAREALANIVKHAAAKTTTIAVTVSLDRVKIVVEDDGRGFEPEQARQWAEKHNHFGLIGLTEQALLVDGTLTIDSEVGRGTQVAADLPIPHPNVNLMGDRLM